MWSKLNQTYNNPNIGFESQTLLLVLLFFIIFKLILGIFSSTQPAFADDLTTTNIIEAVNRERSLRNLSQLSQNDQLTVASQFKADDMIQRHFFSHTDPEGNFIWPKIASTGYSPYLQLGENLAIEFYTTESLVSEWMNSPTHRANILQEGFKDQGAGLAFGNVQNGQYFSSVANIFGTLILKKLPIKQESTSVSEETKPKYTPTKKIKAKKAKNLLTKNTPTNTTAPVETNSINPIFGIRGASDPSFSLPQRITPGTLNQTSTNTPLKANALSRLQVIPQKTSRHINQNITFILGFVLLVLLLSDLKIMIKNKLGYLDKKINNILILLLSLLAIGYLYFI